MKHTTSKDGKIYVQFKFNESKANNLPRIGKQIQTAFEYTRKRLNLFDYVATFQVAAIGDDVAKGKMTIRYTFEKRKTYRVQIECPNCGAIETAIVEHDDPFNTYIHDCTKCGYTITESEWNEVKQDQ